MAKKKNNKEKFVFFTNEIVVKESIALIFLEGLVFSVLMALAGITIAKLYSTQILHIMWLIIQKPECIILPFIPAMFFIFVFIKLLFTILKEKK